MTAAGIGDSGFGFSAISRGNPEPAAEGRTADSRVADAQVAGTCHPLSDLAKMIGERNHLANGRDAVAPYLKTKY